MLVIRLQRVGRKHDPNYRVVLIDSRQAARSGAVKEVLGFYDVKRGGAKFSGDKVKEWISKGARVSDTVHNLLLREKVITGRKINVLPPKKKNAEEPKAAEKPKEALQTSTEKPVEAASQPADAEPKKEEVKV